MTKTLLKILGKEKNGSKYVLVQQIFERKKFQSLKVSGQQFFDLNPNRTRIGNNWPDFPDENFWSESYFWFK